MGNYFFTTGSKFKPFEYKDLIEPFESYKADYEKAEKELTEIEAQAALVDSLAKDPNNKDIYNTYNNYSNELSNVRDLLINNGLGAARQKLNKLKVNYNAQIKPIEEAHKEYKKRMDERRAIKQKDSSVMYTNNISVSDFLNGNVPEDYYVSGNDVIKNTALMVNGRASRKYIDSVASGENPEVVLSEILNLDSDENRQIQSTILNSIPNYDSLDSKSKERIANYIIEGFATGFDPLIKNEIVGKVQRESFELQKKQYAEANKQKKVQEQKYENELRVRGYKLNPDGSVEIDPNTPAGKKLLSENPIYNDIGQGEGKLVGFAPATSESDNGSVTSKKIGVIEYMNGPNRKTKKVELYSYEDLPADVQTLFKDQKNEYYYYFDDDVWKFVKASTKKNINAQSTSTYGTSSVEDPNEGLNI